MQLLPQRLPPERKPEPVVDETLDLAPSTYKFDPSRIDAYLEKTFALDACLNPKIQHVFLRKGERTELSEIAAKLL